MMPQKITCRGCGEVFYTGNDLKSPKDIIQQLKGVCPKCGKRLTFDFREVDIRVIREEEKNKR